MQDKKKTNIGKHFKKKEKKVESIQTFWNSAEFF